MIPDSYLVAVLFGTENCLGYLVRRSGYHNGSRLVLQSEVERFSSIFVAWACGIDGLDVGIREAVG